MLFWNDDGGVQTRVKQRQLGKELAFLKIKREEMMGIAAKN